MNSLRELVLILSTFLWIGGGIWIMVAIIASDTAISGAEAAALAPRKSYYVFGIGIAVFIANTFAWKQTPRED